MHQWVDGSLRDGQWYVAVFQKIECSHPLYQRAILHIKADDAIVYARARARAVATGRHVPDSEIADSLARVPRAVEMLTPYASFVAIIDNSSAVPTLLKWVDNTDFDMRASGSSSRTSLSRLSLNVLPRRQSRSSSSRHSSRSTSATSRQASVGADGDVWRELCRRFQFEHKSHALRRAVLRVLTVRQQQKQSTPRVLVSLPEPSATSQPAERSLHVRHI